MEAALYGEGGFFATGHGAGRAGRDFVTSPEVGPLFGACVGRALDRLWRALGEPDPVPRRRSRAPATAASPARCCAPSPRASRALRYVLVERSARVTRRAARTPPARTGRRGARPVRAPRQRRPGRARSRGRSGVHRRSRSCPRSQPATRSCSRTSYSTTCRSGSRSGTASVGSRSASVGTEPRRIRGSARTDRCRPRGMPSRPVHARSRSRAAWTNGGSRCEARRPPRLRARRSTTRPRSPSSGPGPGCARTARTRPVRTRFDSPGDQDITADVVLEQLDAAARRSSGVRDRPPGRVARRARPRRAGGRGTAELGGGRGPRRPRGAGRPQPRRRGRGADRPARARRASGRRCSPPVARGADFSW